jgi:hypothetical protein
MLEHRCNELAGSFGRTVPTDPSLRLSLQLVQRDIHGLMMRVSHAFISAYQSRKGYRFGR